MALRILHIVPDLAPGGTAKQVVLLAKKLARGEFDVHVCGLHRGGTCAEDLRDAGIPTEIIRRRWKADPLAYGKLRRHIRRVRPDIVHTWLFDGGAFGRPAALAECIPAVIQTERCPDPRRGRWEWWIERRLAQRTARLVANSAAVADYLRARGLPREKLATIADGVPAGRGSDGSRGELLRELDLPPDARLIGAVGRLVPHKRIKDVIWAAELTSVLHPGVHLLVIGDGPQRDDLERFASLASGSGRVRFLGRRDDVERILPHLDVLWQGSEYAGLSSAVLEAMAAGVPVVATNIPGHRELVIPEETGFLVPIAGRAEYARATDRILSNTDLARKIGDAGRRRATERFSVDQMVRAYARLYRDVVPTDENR